MGRGFHLTIDEWFFHWFASETKYKQAAKLFIKIYEVFLYILNKKPEKNIMIGF